MLERRAAIMTDGEAVARHATAFAPALVAALLGTFLILGAGFAPISVIHNAAHDTRHAFAFPCH
ncbi:MAG TPA: CbtB-domain containing protein [Stellaceae bacterium]|nr:CbtB-domain containing protein [Stellaceae bacterium]